MRLLPLMFVALLAAPAQAAPSKLSARKAPGTQASRVLAAADRAIVAATRAVKAGRKGQRALRRARLYRKAAGLARKARQLPVAVHAARLGGQAAMAAIRANKGVPRDKRLTPDDEVELTPDDEVELSPARRKVLARFLSEARKPAQVTHRR